MPVCLARMCYVPVSLAGNVLRANVTCTNVLRASVSCTKCVQLIKPTAVSRVKSLGDAMHSSDLKLSLYGPLRVLQAEVQ